MRLEGAAARAAGLAVMLAGLASAGRAAPAEAWREFQGTWSASGRRDVVAIEGGAAAAIVEISGAVVLSNDSIGRGFRGEAIGFDDGQGLSVGRCVWTDANGDRLFSRLKGEPLQTGKRVVGTISGGTGRYAGAEGEYSFTWQYVVPTEDGQIQGRAVGLSGRLRRAGNAR